MKSLSNVLMVALLATAGASSSVGCKKENAAPAAKAEAPLTSMSVTDLEASIARGDCIPVDANSDATRKRMGLVPGAVKLSDSETFAASELPADKSKSLVFYCGGEQCNASHVAARRAMAIGYANVKIMSAGISGWVEAGKKVQTL
ncbi:MAG TPA: rhodanese-like domain-containing protein [Kofleriaceae bacterium]|nr:rhodanese-like domain-containing protein [Kofleriaceae bacterium]